MRIFLIAFLMICFSGAAQGSLGEYSFEPLTFEYTEINDETLEAELDQYKNLAEAISLQEQVETQEMKVKSIKLIFARIEKLIGTGAISEMRYLEAKSRLAEAEAELRQLVAEKAKVHEEVAIARYIALQKGNSKIDRRAEMTQSMERIYDAKIEYYEAEIQKVQAKLIYLDRMKDNSAKLVDDGHISTVDHHIRMAKARINRARIKRLHKVIASLKEAKVYLGKTKDRLGSELGSL